MRIIKVIWKKNYPARQLTGTGSLGKGPFPKIHQQTHTAQYALGGQTGKQVIWRTQGHSFTHSFLHSLTHFPNVPFAIRQHGHYHDTCHITEGDAAGHMAWWLQRVTLCSWTPCRSESGERLFGCGRLADLLTWPSQHYEWMREKSLIKATLFSLFHVSFWLPWQVGDRTPERGAVLPVWLRTSWRHAAVSMEAIKVPDKLTCHLEPSPDQSGVHSIHALFRSQCGKHALNT